MGSSNKKTTSTPHSSGPLPGLKEYRNIIGNMLSGMAYHRIVLDDGGKPIDKFFSKSITLMRNSPAWIGKRSSAERSPRCSRE